MYINTTAKIIILCIFSFMILLLIFIVCKQRFTNTCNDKWLALTFSQNTLIPEEKEVPLTQYTGGLLHNKECYLSQLPLIATQLNRKAVLPPPWLSLCPSHNNDIRVDKNDTWADYYDTDFFKNIDLNPPLEFAYNGAILSQKSFKYYDITTPLKDFDNNIDIIILTNFDNPKTGNRVHDILPDNLCGKISKFLIPTSKFIVSKLLKQICDNLVQEFNLQNYTFIHIRRGDTLDNESYAPPNGTSQYTDPTYVAKFLNKFSKDNIILIATDEIDPKYKEQLISLLLDRVLIFEDNLHNYIPANIIQNNYKVYQIMSALANGSNTNIITSKLRLGKKHNYSLMKNYFSIV